MLQGLRKGSMLQTTDLRNIQNQRCIFHHLLKIHSIACTYTDAKENVTGQTGMRAKCYSLTVTAIVLFHLAIIICICNTAGNTA